MTDMRITIDRDTALQLVTDVVTERGEHFVYEADMESQELMGISCFYAKDGEPSCGVGLALSKAGVPIHVLEEMDNEPSGETQINFYATIETLNNNGFYLEDGALKVFMDFQTYQDRGMPYREVLELTLENG